MRSDVDEAMSNDPLRKALIQIKAVCTDNATAPRNDLALKFIREIAVSALAKSAPASWADLSCQEQFDLATKIAANVGYVLAPEPNIQAAENAQDARAEVIEECAEAAQAEFASCISEYILIGPGGIASRMVGAIRALAELQEKGDE